MQENIKIRKVKLLKEGEKLEVEFQETGEMKSSTDKTCDTPVHPDLKQAVKGLRVHLAILSDYITEKQARDQDELEKFVCTGYSIGGKEDQEGFMITGYRKTKRGGTVTINTPFERFEQSQESQYILMGDVVSKIETIENESKLYLFEGKRAPEEQQSLDFGEEPVTKIQIMEPAGAVTIIQGYNDGNPDALNGAPKTSEQGKRPRTKVKQTAENPSGEA